MLDFRRLSYFLAIVQAGSFTRAADELRVAQPALSHHLSQMELSLGVKLLDRHPRGVVPTDAGLVLAKQAERLIRELRITEQMVRDFSDQVTGEVVIGIISSLAGVITGPLLAAVRSDLPRVRVYIQEGNSQTLSRGLQENRIDMVVNLSGASSHNSEPLADEPLYLVSNSQMAPGHEEISFKRVLELPLILPTRKHVIRSVVEGAASQVGASANVVWEIDGNSTVRSAVLQGFGHTIMGRTAFAGESLQDFNLCRIVSPALSRRIILQRSEMGLNQLVISRITEVIQNISVTQIAKGIWTEPA